MILINRTLEHLGNMGLVPLAVLDDAKDAVPLAKALQAGGIDTMEITFRTDCALECIASVKEQVPGFLIGAGTVLTVKQAQDAVKAGADYIVMPGFDPAIVDWCLENGIAVAPGCVTPTEVQTVVAKGLNVVKFFPAEKYGGVKTLASLSEPFFGVKFMPTGGVNLENLSDYVTKDFIFAVGGSWLCPKNDVKAGNWEKITETAKASVRKLLDFQVVHVGINTNGADEADRISGELSGMFGFPQAKGAGSTFVGSGFEIMHTKGFGANGHIAVDTNSVARAEYYLLKMGVTFNEESRVMNNGKTAALYLKKEFGGFAIHLRQRT
jgi:2-dehydro-3-deoxyphosphogluconate aldolase / (4S)-4-hydroxy-2-oxoglutarate aldolase